MCIRDSLTGVLITLEAGVLRMVATDSYRLAITDAPLPNSCLLYTSRCV